MPEATTTGSVQNLLFTILALLVILISVGSIYAFIRAIMLFIFSQGKEESIKKAWNSIRFMIVGMFLTIFLLFMFPFIFKRMGLDSYEEYSAKNIFNKAGEILNKTLKIKDIVSESQKDNQYRNNLYYDDNFSDRFSEDYRL